MNIDEDFEERLHLLEENFNQAQRNIGDRLDLIEERFNRMERRFDAIDQSTNLYLSHIRILFYVLKIFIIYCLYNWYPLVIKKYSGINMDPILGNIFYFISF